MVIMIVLCILAEIVLIALKIAGTIHQSWLLVLFPVYFPFIGTVFILTSLRK